MSSRSWRSRLGVLRKFLVVVLKEGVRDAPALMEGSKLRPETYYPLLAWAVERYGYLTRADARRFWSWFRKAGFSGKHRPSREFGTPWTGSYDFAVQVDDGVVLLWHPDAEMTDHDLCVMLNCMRSSKADICYADELYSAEDDSVHPYFKPDFSPTLLENEDYVGPVFLIREEALNSLLATGGEGCGHYNLLLSAYVSDRKIEHATGAWIRWSSRRSMGVPRDRLVRSVRSRKSPLLATLIIPTRDRLDLLTQCIASIDRYPSPINLELIIVDNGSKEEETLRWLGEVSEKRSDTKVVRCGEPFNWSRLNNLGRKAANGDLLVFLNNDIEILDNDWLQRLATAALEPNAGVTGALLLYPDGRIQHAGIVVGIGGVADHIYRGVPGVQNDGHIFVDPYLNRNVLCCTGACLAIESRKFDAAGGFDESLRITGDVELGVRLHRQGFWNVFLGEVRLIHHEFATRTAAPLPPEEVQNLLHHIGDFLEEGDPFYNRLLDYRSRYPTYAEK